MEYLEYKKWLIEALKSHKLVLTLAVIFLGAFVAVTNEPVTLEDILHTYICEATGEKGVFYGNLSSTGLSGYPNADNRKGYKRCYNPVDGSASKWISFAEFAFKSHFNPDDEPPQIKTPYDDLQRETWVGNPNPVGGYTLVSPAPK